MNDQSRAFMNDTLFKTRVKFEIDGEIPITQGMEILTRVIG
ncbi:hypothetical protein ACMAY5_09450 [Arenicellales bacterium nBUS_48]|jgi:hypothetical protein